MSKVGKCTSNLEKININWFKISWSAIGYHDDELCVICYSWNIIHYCICIISNLTVIIRTGKRHSYAYLAQFCMKDKRLYLIMKPWWMMITPIKKNASQKKNKNLCINRIIIKYYFWLRLIFNHKPLNQLWYEVVYCFHCWWRTYS